MVLAHEALPLALLGGAAPAAWRTWAPVRGCDASHAGVDSLGGLLDRLLMGLVALHLIASPFLLRHGPGRHNAERVFINILILAQQGLTARR